MAPPSVTAIVNFVKKYPITLCGFSLLFMPSVHRLLVYFSPLLLSTAIFIVAMLTWGPSMSGSERNKRRRARRNEWAFNGSLKIYDDEEEEEEEEEREEGEQEGEEDEDITTKTGKASKKPDPKLQDPDEKIYRVVPASYVAIPACQTQPEPDLGADGVGTVSNSAIAGSEDPDLCGDGMGMSHSSAGATSCGQAELNPDLHGDHVETDCSAKPDIGGDCVEAATATGDVDHREPSPDLHGEQHVELADHLHTVPDSDQCVHNHEEPETASLDQQHAEPDPDLHGEIVPSAAGNAKSEGAHTENNDQLNAAIAELRQKLEVMKRGAYGDDPRSQQLPERVQTLQAAA